MIILNVGFLHAFLAMDFNEYQRHFGLTMVSWITMKGAPGMWGWEMEDGENPK